MPMIHARWTVHDYESEKVMASGSVDAETGWITADARKHVVNQAINEALDWVVMNESPNSDLEFRIGYVVGE